MRCIVQEKFSVFEVASLRSDLLHCELDSFQVAEAIKIFVAKRGYGISAEMVRDIAGTIEDTGYSMERFHTRLETLALVM